MHLTVSKFNSSFSCLFASRDFPHQILFYFFPSREDGGGNGGPEGTEYVMAIIGKRLSVDMI